MCQNKSKNLLEMLAEAGKKMSPSTVTWVSYQYFLKDHSIGKNTLLQKQHKNSDYSLEMLSGIKTLIFRYVFCGLIKLKFMWRKKEKLKSQQSFIWWKHKIPDPCFCLSLLLMDDNNFGGPNCLKKKKVYSDEMSDCKKNVKKLQVM